MTTTELHCFERAGLGKAPFRCVGMVSIPSATLAERNPQAYAQAMADLPRNVGCGSCQFCGMAIMHNYIIKSADERRFVVGCDCVGRTGDAGLIKETRKIRLQIAQEKRAVKRNMARAEREAMWKAERAERAATFVAEHAALIERAAAFYDIDFVKDVIERAKSGGFVSDKALNAVIACIDATEAINAKRRNSRHTGEIGKRLTFKVVAERITSFERPSFAGYGYETVYIVTLREIGTDNALVVKSSSFRPVKGATLTIKGTVKEHNAYRGEEQTIIQRVKIPVIMDVARWW